MRALKKAKTLEIKGVWVGLRVFNKESYLRWYFDIYRGFKRFLEVVESQIFDI